MTTTAKISREQAIEVANAYFHLYRVDPPVQVLEEDGIEVDDDEIDGDGKGDVHEELVRYARKGFLFLNGDGDVCWDPDGALGDGGVVFRKASGRDLAVVYQEDKSSARRGKKAQDEGLLRLCSRICGSNVSKLRNLEDVLHARMPVKFAMVLV